MHLMLDVARHGGTDPVSLSAVAERTDLSRGYLEQLAGALRRARLLRGVSGRRGGYRLAVDASEITVGAVVEATIGPVCVVDCVEDPAGCPRSGFCEARVVYSLINNRISEVLHTYTLADLLEPSWLDDHGLPVVDPSKLAASFEGVGCAWNPKPQGASRTRQGSAGPNRRGGKAHGRAQNR